jgi:hypothetical protein
MRKSMTRLPKPMSYEEFKGLHIDTGDHLSEEQILTLIERFRAYPSAITTKPEIVAFVQYTENTGPHPVSLARCKNGSKINYHLTNHSPDSAGRACHKCDTGVRQRNISDEAALFSNMGSSTELLRRLTV